MSARAVRLTPEGRKALREAAVSPEHRRVLSLIDFQGSTTVIRAFLRRYPDAQIDQWLGELAARRLTEDAGAPPEPPLQFSGAHSAPIPPVLEQDEKRLADEAWAASNLLSAAGAYIAQDRVRHRAPLGKARGDIEILVVEDDPDQRALARQRLQSAGYRVREAGSAKALAEMLEKEAPPDLMLLDVVLPDGDGFDILGSLRRHPRHALLPVVMLTVKSDPADIRTGLALAADGYVTKPYDARALAGAIDDVLGAAA